MYDSTSAASPVEITVFQSKFPSPIAAIRGPGAMIAFDVVKYRGSTEPDADATRRVTEQALAAGLVLLSCGTNANVIRILVPLTASDAIIDEGLAKLEQALAA